MAKKEKQIDLSQEMTFEQAKAFKASLYKPTKPQLSISQKREQFRIFWAKNRRKYTTRTNDLENVLWLHMKATSNDDPENFKKGLQSFGLKPVSK